MQWLGGSFTPSSRRRRRIANRFRSRGKGRTGRAEQTKAPFYSPHMPRRGAPQPQGPLSAERPCDAPPATAKADRSFSSFVLWQEVHSTGSEAPLTILSNCVPHSRHWYSKIGINSTPSTQGYELYSNTLEGILTTSCAGSVHMRLGQVAFHVARYSMGVLMSRVR